MIPCRLSPGDVVETAKLLSPLDVPFTDPRLAGVDQVLVRGLTLMTQLLADPKVPSTYFVEWPDMSLGIAHLWPDEPRRSTSLMVAYALARARLEQLALECFFLYDQTMPH